MLSHLVSRVQQVAQEVLALIWKKENGRLLLTREHRVLNVNLYPTDTSWFSIATCELDAA